MAAVPTRARHEAAIATRDRRRTSAGSSVRLDGCGARATARDAQLNQSGGGGGKPFGKRRERPSSPYSSFNATTSAASSCAWGCAAGPRRSARTPRGARWIQASRSATGTTACCGVVSAQALQLTNTWLGAVTDRPALHCIRYGSWDTKCIVRRDHRHEPCQSVSQKAGPFQYCKRLPRTDLGHAHIRGEALQESSRVEEGQPQLQLRGQVGGLCAQSQRRRRSCRQPVPPDFKIM